MKHSFCPVCFGAGKKDAIKNKIETWTILREKLAELEHDQWISWTRYIFKNHKRLPAILTVNWIKNWQPYKDLSEEIKDKDRIWADKAIRIIKRELKR